MYPVHNITPSLAMKSLTSFFIFKTNVVTSLMCEEVRKPITIHSVGVIQVGGSVLEWVLEVGVELPQMWCSIR